jgi:hypothetical protein
MFCEISDNWRIRSGNWPGARGAPAPDDPGGAGEEVEVEAGLGIG